MRVLMLVWTGVVTDSRVLREAGALVEAGHSVHIIGRGVPGDYVPPAGITVESAGLPPRAEGRARRLSAPERLARWALLPNHVDRRVRGWGREVRSLAVAWAAAGGPPDVVHAHDYTALEVGHGLAAEWGVPLIYDTHEYWRGRPVEGRPAPLLRRRERRIEDRLVRDAAAVITVGDGVARALRADHPDWPAIHVVQNSFPLREVAPVASPPTAAVYTGQLARDRELETIASASGQTDLPLVLMGPAEEAWLADFEPASVEVRGPGSVAEADAALASAGIALVTHSDRWENHRLALPNKLFHALSIGVPVVATDVGELAAAVRRYDVGALYLPGDAAGLVAAIEEVRERHTYYCERVRDAQADTGWPKDRDVLLQVYSEVSRRPADDTVVPSQRPDAVIRTVDGTPDHHASGPRGQAPAVESEDHE